MLYISQSFYAWCTWHRQLCQGNGQKNLEFSRNREKNLIKVKWIYPSQISARVRFHRQGRSECASVCIILWKNSLTRLCSSRMMREFLTRGMRKISHLFRTIGVLHDGFYLKRRNVDRNVANKRWRNLNAHEFFRFIITSIIEKIYSDNQCDTDRA